MEIVKWGKISFYVTPKSIKSFRDLSISAAVETEDSTTGGEKFIKLKNKGSYQITLTAILNKALNVDVKKTAINEMAEAARRGDTGYFYFGGEKLLTPMFMATEAKISNVVITPKNGWVSCEVAMTFKQCSKFGGGGSGSGGGGSGGGNGIGYGSARQKGAGNGTEVLKSGGEKKDALDEILKKTKERSLDVLKKIARAKLQSQKVREDAKKKADELLKNKVHSIK